MEERQIGRTNPVQWLRENPHYRWVVCLVPILVCYFMPELLVTTDYHATQIALDARIPFIPEFIYFYILWFVMLAAIGLWLLHFDGRGFREYMLFLTASYFLCAVIYLCFPNGQDLRPKDLEVTSLATWILSKLYGFDTNTNVLPSLHVVGAIGVACSTCLTPTIRSKTVKAVTIVLAVLVSISTVFVKQHAVLDVAAGAAVGGILFLLVHRITEKWNLHKL